jgi:hypothetical protein
MAPLSLSCLFSPLSALCSLPYRLWSVFSPSDEGLTATLDFCPLGPSLECAGCPVSPKAWQASWPLAHPFARYPSLFTGPLDLCMRLSPRPPSIKVWQRPPSLSLWLSCVEIWPVKLIRTKTTVSAFKQLQREGGGWWSCPSVVGCALTVPSLLANLIFSGSGKP